MTLTVPELSLVVLVGAGTPSAAEKLPDLPLNFISDYCLDCHDADTTEGKDIWENLALSSIGGLASSTILIISAMTKG